MPATYTDRLDGLTTSVAVKAPCRVATTAAITLSGLQAIDGVTVVSGDRVLVKNQASAISNGIYSAQNGTWVRALDFDGTRDVVGGTLLKVNQGTINTNSYWEVGGNGLLTPGADALIIIPTSGNITLHADLLASGGSALVGFLQSGSGAVARTAQDKMRDAISVKDFGAVGDGVTDDTAAIQAALNGGGQVNFPRGTYKVNATLSITTGVALTAGMGSAFILTGSATNNVIAITGPTAGSGAANVTIDGLQFDTAVTRTAGSYIEVSNGVYNVDISRCRFTNAFNAVRNTGVGGFGFYVRNCIFYYTTNINVLIDNSAPAVEMILENLNILGPSALANSVAGVKVTCAGDLTLRHIATVKAGKGLWVAPTAGVRVQLMLVDTCFFDSGTDWGAYLQTDGGDIDCFKATDCWSATSSAGGGWYLGASGNGGFIRQATLTSCEGHNNTLQGFRIGANNVNTTLSLCAASNNTLEGCLVDATTTRFKIVDNTFGPTGEFIIGNGTNGIKVAAGVSNNYWIMNNYVSGNGSTGLVDGGTGGTKFVSGNI